MAVYKRGYQRYQGPVTGRLARFFVLPRFAWARLFEQRLIIVMLALSCVWPLLCMIFVYISHHAELWSGLGSAVSRLLQIDARFFLTFMNVQAAFCVLLAALAGPGLVAPDLANNALPLYFSRPLARLEYVLARITVLAGLFSLVTCLPALLLVLMQAGLAPAGWFAANWRIVCGVLAGFLLWILLVSLVALASSAYVKWRIIAGALILGFFFILAGAGAMVNGIFRVEWGSIINPSKAAYAVWCALLGADLPEGAGLGASLAVLLFIAAVLVLVLERKLRAVEIVS